MARAVLAVVGSRWQFQPWGQGGLSWGQCDPPQAQGGPWAHTCGLMAHMFLYWGVHTRVALGLGGRGMLLWRDSILPVPRCCRAGGGPATPSPVPWPTWSGADPATQVGAGCQHRSRCGAVPTPGSDTFPSADADGFNVAPVTTAKLSHPTAARPRVPGQRPPSLALGSTGRPCWGDEPHTGLGVPLPSAAPGPPWGAEVLVAPRPEEKLALEDLKAEVRTLHILVDLMRVQHLRDLEDMRLELAVGAGLSPGVSWDSK
ncbi:putative LOC102087593 [Columba livia]|uniref:Putative LOC102087593 n=1 Tax=Columba livia TaxID=8932 RepID=A0A2I0LRR5_COLLI|nr:putative LOC102087593 [Columba livia]